MAARLAAGAAAARPHPQRCRKGGEQRYTEGLAPGSARTAV